MEVRRVPALSVAKARLTRFDQGRARKNASMSA
jgi:hypothetical protein